MIAEAIRLRLLAMPEVAGYLSEYRGEPAAFCLNVLPPDAALPAMIVMETGGRQVGTVNHWAVETGVDVTIWQPRDYSTRDLRQLGILIGAEIDGTDAGVADYYTNALIAGPPVILRDDDGFEGMNIPLLVTVMREERDHAART